MQKELEKYVIKGVGNYQLCVKKENGGHSFIIPLNYIQEDKIIKLKNKQFLVLKHAFIEDIDFINFIMNSRDEIVLDINANHEMLSDNSKCHGESKFIGRLFCMTLEHECRSAGIYKIVIELSETNLMCQINKDINIKWKSESIGGK